MAYRGTGLTYKIRKTTKNNKTGDNFSITVPTVIAKKFEATLFKLTVSGNALVFESGCKLTTEDMININNAGGIYAGGGNVVFR